MVLPPSSTGAAGHHGEAVGPGGVRPRGVQRHVAGSGKDGRRYQPLGLREALQEPRRAHPIRQELARLRLRGQQSGLRIHFVLNLALQQDGGLHEELHLVVGGFSEPRLQAVIHHLIAEQHQEEDRQETQGECAHHQLGLDARAFPVALPLDVELDAFAEQYEPQRHHEDEDEARDGPENECLVGIRWTELPRTERSLPHHQRHRQYQRHDGEPVEQGLSHGTALFSIIRVALAVLPPVGRKPENAPPVTASDGVVANAPRLSGVNLVPGRGTHDHRRSQGNQGPRDARRAGAQRRHRAARGGPRGAGGDARRRRQLHHRPGIHGDRRRHSPERGGSVAAGPGWW